MMNEMAGEVTYNPYTLSLLKCRYSPLGGIGYQWSFSSLKVPALMIIGSNQLNLNRTTNNRLGRNQAGGGRRNNVAGHAGTITGNVQSFNPGFQVA